MSVPVSEKIAQEKMRSAIAELKHAAEQFTERVCVSNFRRSLNGIDAEVGLVEDITVAEVKVCWYDLALGARHYEFSVSFGDWSLSNFYNVIEAELERIQRNG